LSIIGDISCDTTFTLFLLRGVDGTQYFCSLSPLKSTPPPESVMDVDGVDVLVNALFEDGRLEASCAIPEIPTEVVTGSAIVTMVVKQGEAVGATFRSR
jgi:hypothetical protein